MNSEPSFYSRRALLTVAATMAFFPTLTSRAQTPVAIEVYKDPNCGCCSGWVDHLRRNGFVVRAIDTKDLQAIKARLGVPPDLASCHTAILNGYVIEGHVPAHAIQRLLDIKPEAIGLAVPGMPIGSPGMEGGPPETYSVTLFGRNGRKIFGRYREDKTV